MKQFLTKRYAEPFGLFFIFLGLIWLGHNQNLFKSANAQWGQSASGGNLSGYVDGIDCTHLWGWVQDTTNPNTNLFIHYSIDNQMFAGGSNAPDQFGRRSFSIGISPGSGSHTISVAYTTTTSDTSGAANYLPKHSLDGSTVVQLNCQVTGTSPAPAPVPVAPYIPPYTPPSYTPPSYTPAPVPPCTPSCGDTSTKCTTQSWSDGCGGICWGSKNCSTANNPPATSCTPAIFKSGLVNSVNLQLNDNFTVECDYGVKNTDRINAFLGNQKCQWMGSSQNQEAGWNGTAAKFTCLADTIGLIQPKCIIEAGGNKNICQGSVNLATQVNIQAGGPSTPDLSSTNDPTLTDIPVPDDQPSPLTIPSNSLSIPMSVPVVSVLYYPITSDGRVDIDILHDLYDSSIDNLRSKIQTYNSQLIILLDEGSDFHRSGQKSLHYNLADQLEIQKKLPVSTLFPGKVDHFKILTQDLDVCNYVDNQGVKEIWIWSYAPKGDTPSAYESNMSMGTKVNSSWNNLGYGDISNSGRENDLPICQNTYTVYFYNFGREIGTALEDHSHQIESIFLHIDQNLFNNFVGPKTPDASAYGCGWTHYPPNTIGLGKNNSACPNSDCEYRWSETKEVMSYCEDWQPQGGGATKSTSCQTWGCNSEGGVSFKVWWMQNIPGYNNKIVYQGKYLKNFWEFIGNFDTAIKDKTLVNSQSSSSESENNLNNSNVGASSGGIGGQILDTNRILAELSNVPGTNYTADTAINDISQATDLVRALVNAGVILIDSDSDSQKEEIIKQIAQILLGIGGPGTVGNYFQRIESSGGFGGPNSSLFNIDGIRIDDNSIIRPATTPNVVTTPSTAIPDTSQYTDKLSPFFDKINIFKPGTTIPDLIKKIINLAMTLAGLVALAFIIYGGYLYIMSAGSPEESKKAMQAITQAAIGLVLVLAAWLIIMTVINVLQK